MIKRAASLFSKGQPHSPLRVEFELASPLERLDCDYGEILELDVRVTNTGTEPLDSSHPSHPDFTSYHWLSPSGESLVEDGLRTPFAGIVNPGRSQVVRLRVSASARASGAVLAIDVVREGLCWLSQVGSVPLTLPCSIAGAGEVTGGSGGADDSLGPDAAGVAGTVDEFWGKRAEVRATGEWLGWLDHPVVLQECMLPKLETGETNWLLAMMRRHDVPRVGDWLSLGCGEGGLELWLVERGEAGTIDGVDVSAKAVEIANAASAESRLDTARFRVIDLDNDELPADAYDVVIASMAIHHIEKLEGAFDKIHRALKPGGYFFANEYVGPSRFNFPPEQVELANRVIAGLPRDLRRDVMASRARGTTVYKDRYVWRSPEHWLEIDPSEAVRSADIISVFTGTFEQTWVYEFGGPLMHLVLENIVANFDPGNDKDRSIIRLLDLFETALIKAGYLNNDFAVLAGRKA
jgi:SAM-dependent methyltransferase